MPDTLPDCGDIIQQLSSHCPESMGWIRDTAEIVFIGMIAREAEHFPPSDVFPLGYPILVPASEPNGCIMVFLGIVSVFVASCDVLLIRSILLPALSQTIHGILRPLMRLSIPTLFADST